MGGCLNPRLGDTTRDFGEDVTNTPQGYIIGRINGRPAVDTLSDYVASELQSAAVQRDPGAEFHHLERAHILSQYSTRDHVRVHLEMLRWAKRQRDWKEAIGQVIRIVGAATKTAIGLVPTGNTGGANVSPVKPMPVPRDLAAVIARHRR